MWNYYSELEMGILGIMQLLSELARRQARCLPYAVNKAHRYDKLMELVSRCLSQDESKKFRLLSLDGWLYLCFVRLSRKYFRNFVFLSFKEFQFVGYLWLVFLFEERWSSKNRFFLLNNYFVRKSRNLWRSL